LPRKQAADSKNAAKSAAVNLLKQELTSLKDAAAEGETAKEEAAKRAQRAAKQMKEVQEALDVQQKQVAEMEEAANAAEAATEVFCDLRILPC
jgi:hypothetical protein